MKARNIFACAVAAVLCGVVFAEENAADFSWVDAVSFVEGRGFADAEPYARLPKKAWEVGGIDRVLHAGKGSQATGLALRFKTDSQQVRLRCTMKRVKGDSSSVDGTSAFDVYGWDEARKTWRFERVKNELRGENEVYCTIRRKWTKDQPCLVYLPFRGEISKCEIGVEPGKSVVRIEPPKKRVVHYGTSLVHGGCVSRGGMLFTAIYGRLCDVEVVNLGFSGAAHMQSVMAEFQSDVPADLYIVDPVLNNWAKDVRKKLGPYVKIIREKRPQVPILVCEPASTYEKENERSIATKEVFDELVKEGVENIYLIKTQELMCDDSEGTVDGLHPNDYGAMQMGRAFAKKINEILNK